MTDPQLPSAPTARRPAPWLPWLLILAVGTLLCQLCSVVPFIGVFAAALFGVIYGPANILDAQTGNGSPVVSAETAHVIDAYLEAMAHGDADTAYALFSSEAQAVFTRDDLEQLLTGPEYAQFGGYRAITVEVVNTDRAGDRPRWAEVSGRVIYTGDSVGTYEATLRREGGEWRLSAINLYPPPDKLGPTGAHELLTTPAQSH